MERGTIVLTPFPFTDLSSSKRRPAVVVSKVEKSRRDLIVAFISSVVPLVIEPTDYLLENTNPDFIYTGLKTTSVFKMNKLVTLDSSIFTGEIGYVSRTILKQFDSRLKTALDIK